MMKKIFNALTDNVKKIYIRIFTKKVKTKYKVRKLKDINVVKKQLLFFNNVKDIFVRDMKNIFSNYAAIIVMGGLLLIPSLYAWVNIGTNWDPYSKTGNINIAVINNDEGASLSNNIVNVGNEVAEELKNSDSIGWEIVNEYEANYGLHNGTYYALVEIPADFSADLVSYVSSTPVKPNIIYRSNQKTNAIATKISDAAKTKLTDTIKGNIIKIVNVEVMKVMNKLAEELENNEEHILGINDKLNYLTEENIKAQEQLASETENIANIQTQLEKNKEAIKNLNTVIDKSHEINDGIRNLTNTANNDIKNGVYGLQDNINSINEQSETIDDNLNDIKDTINDPETTESAIAAIDAILEYNELAGEEIDEASENLEESDLDDEASENLDALIDETSDNNQLANETLIELKESLESGEGVEQINNFMDIAIGANDLYKSSVNQLYDFSKSVIIPVSQMNTDTIKQSTRNMDGYSSVLYVIDPQVSATSDFGIAMGKVANDQLLRVTEKLAEDETKLEELSEVVEGVDEEFLDQVITVMKKDPEKVGDFLANPVQVTEIDIYGSNPFGVGLTPFYTVLGIWVGVLLILALLTVELHPFDDGRIITYPQWHFGKMMLFLAISLTQTTICVVGNILILGVRPVHLGLYFELAYLCSLVFTVMIYTLVSLFGNIGKAIAVVIMVFQIAGSDGIYPIQTNPHIFIQMKNLWPFYYAIDGFRQAISGMSSAKTAYDIKWLLVFLIVFGLMGFLKRFIYPTTEFFENEMHKTEL